MARTSGDSYEADPAAARHGDRLIVKRVDELVEAAIHALIRADFFSRVQNDDPSVFGTAYNLYRHKAYRVLG